MAAICNENRWEFTSTGAGKAINCRGLAERLTFGYETSSGCTATIVLQHRLGSSAGPYSALSSQALSTSAFTTDQFSGPFGWVRPYVPAKTAGATNVVTAYLLGNG